MTRILILKGLLLFKSVSMKNHLTLLLLTCSIYGFSQSEEGSIYFPQEQLIHPKCINSQNKNTCLKNIFTSEIQGVLQKYINKVELKKDTLNLNVRFSIDKKGQISNDYQYITINEKSLDKKAGKKLDLIFSKMPSMKVLNKKPEKHNAFHLLHVSFVANNIDGKTVLKQIASSSSIGSGPLVLIFDTLPVSSIRNIILTLPCILFF